MSNTRKSSRRSLALCLRAPCSDLLKPVSSLVPRLRLTYLLRGLRHVQADKPAYKGQSGAHGWWSEVIKRTAIGAGADSQGMRPFRVHTENAWR